MYLLEMTSPITLDVSKFCIEKTIELCATQINTGKRVLIESKVSYSFSKWEKIKCGVPQRSVLGPLLFLIYVNDLSKIIENPAQPICSADDISVIITNHSLTE